MKQKYFQLGAAQVPIIVGLLLMSVALPVSLRLVQNHQDTRQWAESTECEWTDWIQGVFCNTECEEEGKVNAVRSYVKKGSVPAGYISIPYSNNRRLYLYQPEDRCEVPPELESEERKYCVDPAPGETCRMPEPVEQPEEGTPCVYSYTDYDHPEWKTSKYCGNSPGKIFCTHHYHLDWSGEPRQCRLVSTCCDYDTNQVLPTTPPTPTITKEEKEDWQCQPQPWSYGNCGEAGCRPTERAKIRLYFWVDPDGKMHGSCGEMEQVCEYSEDCDRPCIESDKRTEHGCGDYGCQWNERAYRRLHYFEGSTHICDRVVECEFDQTCPTPINTQRPTSTPRPTRIPTQRPTSAPGSTNTPEPRPTSPPIESDWEGPNCDYNINTTYCRSSKHGPFCHNLSSWCKNGKYNPNTDPAYKSYVENRPDFKRWMGNVAHINWMDQDDWVHEQCSAGEYTIHGESNCNLGDREMTKTGESTQCDSTTPLCSKPQLVVSHTTYHLLQEPIWFRVWAKSVRNSFASLGNISGVTITIKNNNSGHTWTGITGSDGKVTITPTDSYIYNPEFEYPTHDTDGEHYTIFAEKNGYLPDFWYIYVKPDYNGQSVHDQQPAQEGMTAQVGQSVEPPIETDRGGGGEFENRTPPAEELTQPLPADLAVTDNCIGDANGDGRVDELDFAVWHYSYRRSTGGDFNNDGVTDEVDYALWWQNFGKYRDR